MSYTPKEWECGETITADALNNLEDGVQEALACCGGGGEGVLYVRFTSSDGETYQASETYADVLSAFESGRPIVFIDEVEYYGHGIAVAYEGDFYASWAYPYAEGGGLLGVYLVSIEYHSDSISCNFGNLN